MSVRLMVQSRILIAISQAFWFATRLRARDCALKSETSVSFCTLHNYCSGIASLIKYYHRTLYESKGLEFNDVGFVISDRLRSVAHAFRQVLLFNFFEDSTADVSQWRVVLNAVPPEQRGKLSAPRFDEARHSGICREVRHLELAKTSIVLITSVAQVPVRRDYEGSQEPLDCRLF